MASKTLFLNLMTLARTQGCFLLSTPSLTGAVVGSAPTPSGRNCATSTTATRTCGPGCWSCRPSPARPRRSSTALRNSPTSTPCSGRRTRKPHRRRHSQELLVLPGFHSPFLLGIVNSFSRKKLVSLRLALQQNFRRRRLRSPIWKSDWSNICNRMTFKRILARWSMTIARRGFQCHRWNSSGRRLPPKPGSVWRQ